MNEAPLDFSRQPVVLIVLNNQDLGKEILDHEFFQQRNFSSESFNARAQGRLLSRVEELAKQKRPTVLISWDGIQDKQNHVPRESDELIVEACKRNPALKGIILGIMPHADHHQLPLEETTFIDRISILKSGWLKKLESSVKQGILHSISKPKRGSLELTQSSGGAVSPTQKQIAL